MVSKKVIQNRPEYAKERFFKSMNCSQAILETYAEETGMPLTIARKVSSAFAGGMGMGAECGAVTAALMVIGMKYGKTEDMDTGAEQKTSSSVATFIEAFRKQHGDILCSKLLGIDMGTPEGVKKAADQGLFISICPKFVVTAATILDKILD